MIPIAQEDTLNATYYRRSNNLRVQPGAEANVRATKLACGASSGLKG